MHYRGPRRRRENIFKDTIAENFPNLGKETHFQVQEAQRIPNSINPKRTTQALNGTIDQIDLIDIYRTFHPKTADYTFFSSEHGTFSRIDHFLCHKSSLSKFKKIEIISSTFSDHNAMRLEINYREKNVKNTNTWRLNNTLLNNQQITEEIKEEIKKYLETNCNENMTIQTYGMQQKQF